MSKHNLVFKAGDEAFAAIQRDGFSIDQIGTIAGASGGAKWLVLSQLDRAIIASIIPRLQGPVHLLGSSIGAWRFACYAQSDPLAALQRFEQAYIEQSYSEMPDIHEITAMSREIVQVLFGDNGVAEVLDSALFRTHIMTVRARHIAASEQRAVLAASLIIAASLNAISRRTLAWFFERALFFDARDIPPFFDVEGFPLQRVMLRHSNLEDAVVATGSIPLILSGVKDIEGALPGTYRDGGVIDYHLDFSHSSPDRYTLYPHFFDYIVPGWFDKRLSWRRANPAHFARTILVSPSAEFVARLPNRKIPDRTDFENYTPAERVRIWHTVVSDCEALADEFNDVIEKGELESRLTSF